MNNKYAEEVILILKPTRLQSGGQMTPDNMDQVWQRPDVSGWTEHGASRGSHDETLKQHEPGQRAGFTPNCARWGSRHNWILSVKTTVEKRTTSPCENYLSA